MPKSWHRFGLRALGALQLLIVLSFAQMALADLPKPITPYVTDYADVLSPEDEARITVKLRDLRRDPGNQVAVITMPNRMGADLPDIEAYATRLFNSWGIGDAARNDGAMILVVVDDREARLELGAGFPPVWDNHALRIMEGSMVPRFAESDYAGGIEAGLDALDAYILRPFAEGRSYEETPFPIEGSSSDWIDGAVIIAMILGGLALIFNKERFALGDMLAKRRPCPKCGRMGVTVVKETHPLSEARKERVTTRHCPHCQWSEERRQMVQTTTSGDDDFGGGQSSGGGATGRW